MVGSLSHCSHVSEIDQKGARRGIDGYKGAGIPVHHLQTTNVFILLKYGQETGISVDLYSGGANRFWSEVVLVYPKLAWPIFAEIPHQSQAFSQLPPQFRGQFINCSSILLNDLPVFIQNEELRQST